MKSTVAARPQWPSASPGTPVAPQPSSSTFIFFLFLQFLPKNLHNSSFGKFLWELRFFLKVFSQKIEFSIIYKITITGFFTIEELKPFLKKEIFKSFLVFDSSILEIYLPK